MNRLRTAIAGTGVALVFATTGQSLAAGPSTGGSTASPSSQPAGASASSADAGSAGGASGGCTQAVDADVVAAAVTAADEFLGLLSDDQRAATVFEYTDLDGKRYSWSNLEASAFDGRQGARLGDLDDDQRAAAMIAVASVLSRSGYEYVQHMMAGEDELASSGDPGFGSDHYFLAFYGEPSTDEPWTLQFGGHHLAIHISVGGDTLSVSPYFQGVQPVRFDVDGSAVEPMATDADDIFGLFEALDDEQLATAELTATLDDLVMGPGIDAGYPEADGLAYTELTAEQQELVRAVIADWVADAAPELVQPLIDIYESQLDETVIGWSISTRRESTAYMRIDGPRVWIEWANRSNPYPAEPGFHYHTIYRDKVIDYGTGATDPTNCTPP